MRADLGSSLPQYGDVAAPTVRRAGDDARRSHVSRWLPALVGLTVLAATLGLWHALLAQERVQIARTVALQLESVKNEIAMRMESRVLALVRMARRWEMRGPPPKAEWESDAHLYVRHYAGYLAIAWVDAEHQARWVVRAESGNAPSELALLLAESRAALQSARERREVTLTRAFKLARDDRAAFLVNVPIFSSEGFDGLIVGVFQMQSLLDTLLREHIAPGYAIAVTEGGRPLYRRGLVPAPDLEQWGQQSVLPLNGVRWEVRVWPSPEVLAGARSPLPQAVLAGGAILALLLALPVRLAQVARARVKEAENANREIKEQMNERREAQDRVRKLFGAVEQSPTMVVITDTHGAIEYVNPKFIQVTGYTPEEVLGKNPRMLKSGETAPAEYRRLWETIAAGGEWRGEFHNKKKNGDLFWEHAAISPIRDERGVITHFLGELEDITERKRLEQEVAERNREMVKTQALAAMGQAASMIAHDLRNPLSTVKMTLQMLGKRSGKPLSETEQELNQIALEQVRYMDEVLSDLLTYSRPDALEPEWLSIDKLLDAAILLAQKPVEEHRVQVATYYQPGLPTLHGDANKLRQAFSNLIMNAAEATEGIDGRTPQVAIRTRVLFTRDRPDIAVEIRDNGCGIVPDLRDRVFEPFFTTRAKGTGLGLAIAKRIIDQHHGSIELQPETHGGTKAVVVLPTGPVQGSA